MPSYSVSHGSSHPGGLSHRQTADPWEPDDGRLSCRVLREPRGEIPTGYLPEWDAIPLVHLPYSEMVHRHLAPTGPCEDNRPMANLTMSSLQDETAAVTYDELIVAIEHHGLQLFYQPIVDLRSKRLRGFEALVRLSDPTLGIIPAADFVPLAENCGLIRPLDDWVFMTSCEQLAGHRRWPGLVDGDQAGAGRRPEPDHLVRRPHGQRLLLDAVGDGSDDGRPPGHRPVGAPRGRPVVPGGRGDPAGQLNAP